ncbi:MAG: shikimate kinase [Rhodothermales bacterium]|nr:shikimate kinase [Rhodothermales bacterium]
MASGKSSLGRNVAAELEFGFLDLDRAIEAEAEKTIRDIFREDGEQAFRAAESAALRATSDLHEHVIALGGGTLVAESNMDWALGHGIVVFLDLPEEELVRRLSRSRTRRPLVEAMLKNPGQLERTVAQLLAERRSAYEKAHLTFRPEKTTAPKNARLLVRCLLPLLEKEDRGSPD